MERNDTNKNQIDVEQVYNREVEMVIEERHVEWILAEAKRRGYTLFEQPVNQNFIRAGRRVGGSKQASGPDQWMNAANVVLYCWQLRPAGSTVATTADLYK